MQNVYDAAKLNAEQNHHHTMTLTCEGEIPDVNGDRERIERFAPLFEGRGNAAQAARAALLPNTFLQALVCRALTGPVLPEVIEE